MTNTNRQQLRARANSLKATIQVGRGGLSAPIIQLIRKAFEKTDLLKIRLGAREGAELDELCREIAREVPCECIARTGRVGVFHGSGAAAATETDEDE